MGVPVITMKGYNFNSRCGESINKNIQMKNLIAQNEEEYISIATNLSRNKNQLIEIRKKLFDNVLCRIICRNMSLQLNQQVQLGHFHIA